MNILNSGSDTEEVLKHAGNKASRLHRMQKNGYPVPAWFCVSAQVHDDFLETLSNEIRDSNLTEEELFRIFKSSPATTTVTAILQAEIDRLGWASEFLAVRSSGIGEDSAEYSFAGQFASFLYQKGLVQIQDSLLRCWASAHSERNIAYRRAHGLESNAIRMAVIIQKMLNSETAGVAFSRNPMRASDRDHLLISSVWGQGQGLVNGEIDADHFEVHRDSLVCNARIAEKTQVLMCSPTGGLQTMAVSADKIMRPSLTQAQIEEVARTVLRLEQDFASPQDFEWAYADGQLYCLQTRPITNLPPAALFNPQVNGAEATIWDNSNIIESYCGVTTPLTFTHVNRCYREVYFQFCRLMGVPENVIRNHEPMFQNMLGLIRGRIYYNLVNWYRLVFLFPGAASNKAFMETMMGVKQKLNPELSRLFDFVKNPPRYPIWRRAKLLILITYRLLRSKQQMHEFMERIDRIYDPLEQTDFTGKSLSEQIAIYRELEESVLKRWTAPIVGDTRCMLAFGILKKLSDKWFGTANASLQNDLLCGGGDLKSTEPTQFLMKIAEAVDLGPNDLRTRFLERNANNVWKSLQAGFAPGIYSLFREFLGRYGFRCVNELKLEAPDLHDDPSGIIAMVQNYVRMKNYSVQDLESREAAIRHRAEEKLRATLPPLKRWIYQRILGWTRQALRDRELLRFARTRTFGVTRRLFRGIGANFVRLGILKEQGDIFYLTLDEIISFQEGRTVLTDFKTLVAIRRQEFIAYANTPAPPDRFLTQGAVGSSLAHPNLLIENDLLIADSRVDQDASVFRGIPCSPGIAEGTIRVAHSFHEAQELNGDILVTEHADPGWVPLFPTCSGLVIERGSLLSHSAVVARELGIPTIVGVGGKPTQRLKTGQRLRMDAGKGEAKVV